MEGEASAASARQQSATPTSRPDPSQQQEVVENLLDSQDEEAFLAAQLEAERQALALAMAESLDEDKARKAAEQPLEEWAQEELLQRFKASSILREHPHGVAALQEKCRKDFVATLEFERQALRWFPGRGTEAYFAQAAKTAAGHALKVKILSKAKQARGTAKGATTRSKSSEKATSSPKVGIVEFASALSKKVKEAKDTVYGMPNGEIPEIFRSPDGESEEDSDVEFLEERTPAKRIKAIDLC